MFAITLIGVIFSGLVGLGGLYVGYRGSSKMIQAQAAEGAANREHERLLASDARIFERRANAYAETLSHCELMIDGLNEPSAGRPKPPTERARIRGADYFGRFNAYATREAATKFDDFLFKFGLFSVLADLHRQALDAGNSMIDLDENLQRLKIEEKPPPLGRHRGVTMAKHLKGPMEKAHEDLLASYEILKAQIRDDLASTRAHS